MCRLCSSTNVNKSEATLGKYDEIIYFHIAIQKQIQTLIDYQLEKN